MSALEYLLRGLRDTILVASNVNRLAANVERLDSDVRDHEKRLTRLETLVEVAQARAAPPRLFDDR